MATEPISYGMTVDRAAQPALAAAPVPATNGAERIILSKRQQPFFKDKNRAFWILQSIGWGGFFVLRTLTGIANSQGLAWVFHTILLTATGYSMTLLMASAYRRLIRLMPLVTWTISISMVLIASASFSAIEVWSLATFVRPGLRPQGIEFLGGLLLDFSLLAAWSALYYGINYYLMLEQKMDQFEHLEHQANAAQLAMLRYQLNPHFLFNTLNSISTLVLLKQTERANAMLSRLSSFLRYTLVNEPTGQVTVAQEIETLKLYLEIEKMRFEDRLRTHFHIDPAAERARLPSLLLQPLIENAIKYAVTPQEQGADISVDVRKVAERVLIAVSDTGPGAEGFGHGTGQQSTGVGLANIRDRLAQVYGADHRFETQTKSNGGFGVVIEIPFQIEAEEMK